MTTELIAAQCFLFFFAGFETSSSAMSFCLLELAKNQKIQDRLIRDIDAALKENDGKITYDLLQRIPYLDQVINETLRIYPTLPILFRECTTDYHLPDSDVVIEKGTTVFIPVYGLHHDPQYYPNPEVFDPENFSEKRTSSRHSYTFIPFGEGPRVCIGMRFAFMQMKLGLITLLRDYTFQVSPRTERKVELLPTTVLTTAKNGIWLSCVERSKPKPT